MKVAYSKYSDFTETDLLAAEQAVTSAQKYLSERKDAYQRAIESAGEGWAKRKKLPLVEEAQKQLNGAVEYYNKLISTIQSGQEIKIADTVATSLTAQPETSATATGTINWKLIGLAIGAVVLIIVIFKFL